MLPVPVVIIVYYILFVMVEWALPLEAVDKKVPSRFLCSNINILCSNRNVINATEFPEKNDPELFGFLWTNTDPNKILY